MAELYECDGCGRTEYAPPALTIENTSGISELSLRDEHHACSWNCVSRIAFTIERNLARDRLGLAEPRYCARCGDFTEHGTNEHEEGA